MEFIEPLKTGFTIYSKSGCSYCTKAKNLLTQCNFLFEEINCDDYLEKDKQYFLNFIKEKANKDFKTFPIVLCDGKFIGGFLETEQLVMFDPIEF